MERFTVGQVGSAIERGRGALTVMPSGHGFTLSRVETYADDETGYTGSVVLVFTHSSGVERSVTARLGGS